MTHLDATLDRAHQLDEILLDLPAVVGAFSRRMYDAGVPVTPSQAELYARSLALTEPVLRQELYWTTRAVFVTGLRHVPIFDRVFSEVFGEPPL
jgi:uncharacterized protein with von Willebrand factor type A (vWA) domain